MVAGVLSFFWLMAWRNPKPGLFFVAVPATIVAVNAIIDSEKYYDDDDLDTRHRFAFG